MTQNTHKYLLLAKSCVLILIILFAVTNLTWAAPPTRTDIEEQNRKARQVEQDRIQRDQGKDVFLQKEKKGMEKIKLPDETPSFFVNTFEIVGASEGRFYWLNELVNEYQAQKIGVQSINLIVKRLTNALIDRGYTTSRVLIPEQDLSQGTLRLVLIPGKVREIRFKDSTFYGNWRNALPIRPGDIFNLRDLEQGLEQMKRVPSQDVNYELVPGPNPGESDVVITVQRTNSLKVTLSLDNSGIEATGKLQFYKTISIDNLFNSNDIFNISFSNDIDRKGWRRGTKGDSLYYSIPYGKTTFSFSNSHNKYHQAISGINQTFVYSGETENNEFSIKHLLNRDQTSKTHLDVSVIKSISRSYLDDTEINVQKKNTTALRVGVSQRKFIGQSVFDWSIADKIGVPWIGAQDDMRSDYGDNPTTRFNIWTLDAGYTTPVTFGKTKAQYRLNIKAQYSKNHLYGSEHFSIGNRYTVRGFDGEETLAAETGWYIQNELGIPINSGDGEVYVGLDHGRVSGPSSQELAGKSLTGAVIGIRGGKTLQYDVFVGWPLKKPDRFTTASTTYGFSTSIQI